MNKDFRNKLFLSIVIPVYNSENSVKKVIYKINDVLIKKVDYEIILVNDGSQDNSSLKCIELTREFSFVKFLDLSKNFGQHNAIIAGLHHVEGQYILLMDDDLQTPPEEAMKLINKIEEGFDVVYANYIDKKHNTLRNFGSLMRDFIANIIFNKPKNIRLSSYFIMRRYLSDEVIKYTGPFTYIGGLILRATNNIANVYVKHKDREYGKSNYTLKRLVSHWINGLVNFTAKPLRISFFIGLACFMIALGFSIFLLIKKIIDPGLTIGWTSTILAVLFFSGVQLIIIGLIGEYIGRMFLIQNKQPQFIIKSRYNIKKK